MNNIIQLKYLLHKEFLQIFRNKTILRMIVFLPIFQLLLLPWAATFEQKEFLISIIDNDKSQMSYLLIQNILSSKYFKIVEYSNSYSESLNSIGENKADLILEIPKNFEKKITNHESVMIMISIDAVNAQKANLAQAYFNQISLIFEQKDVVKNKIKMISGSDSYFRYNPHMDYKYYMLPGILSMLISLVCGMLSSLNIVKEKEQGTIEQINVSPINKGIFILGKIIPFWCISFFILTIGLTVIMIIYNQKIEGNIGHIYIYSFFYFLVISGLGLLISTFSNTQQQAMFVIGFLLILCFLLSGLYTPINSMPHWVQNITLFNPVRYFVEVMRLICLKGAGLYEIKNHIIITIMFAVAFNILAIINYKKIN